MKIEQTVTGGTARGYVASYDTDTQVVKYFKIDHYFSQTKMIMLI